MGTESPVLVYDRLLIGGRWKKPATTGVIEVRSPHDQTVVGRAPAASVADVDRAVAAAREAFDHGPWPAMSPAERQALVARFDRMHAARAEEIAALITAENGMPLWFTRWIHSDHGIRAQIAAYLRAAESFAWEERIGPCEAPATVIRREPVGVVAAVIPWHVPHYFALAKIVPAVLAGCTVALKASPETALDALLLGEIVSEAGFPDGVISILPGDRGTSEYLVSHCGVDKISFTGSTAAGRRIATIAGHQLKRLSLELGGKSASIILDDADLTTAIAGLRRAALAGNGESCTAQTRILASRKRHDEVVAALKDMVEEVVVGDPSDPSTFIGPLVRADQQERVRSYIELGREEGARLVTGGSDVPAGLERGFYVRPTLFADVDNAMRIAREEIFGPVLTVIPYEDEDDAVRIANDSMYGLGGGVWTGDRGRGMDIARRIRTGTFSVNGAGTGFDGPFGGYKSSGIGREFGAVGLGEYAEYKTITV